MVDKINECNETIRTIVAGGENSQAVCWNLVVQKHTLSLANIQESSARLNP